jgi:4-hydroxy-tetrahydrodipicolinate synthase
VAATPPYYYPHSQDEVLEHYRTLRGATSRPLFVYNIPQTVRVRVELPTLFTLIDEGVVDGMKDSQNDLEYMRQLTMRVRDVGADFAPFVGTRYLIDAALLVGANGAIPSIANAFPELCVDAFNAADAGSFEESAAICRRLAALENVAAVATAGSRNAALLGTIKAVLAGSSVIDSPDLTGPLRNLSPAEIEAVRERVAVLEGTGVA